MDEWDRQSRNRLILLWRRLPFTEVDKSCCCEWTRWPANTESKELSCGVVCLFSEVGKSFCGELTRGPANAEFDEFPCGVVCHCSERDRSSYCEWARGPAIANSTHSLVTSCRSGQNLLWRVDAWARKSKINEFLCGFVCRCAEVDKSSCGGWTRGPANAEFDESFVASSASVQKWTKLGVAS